MTGTLTFNNSTGNKISLNDSNAYWLATLNGTANWWGIYWNTSQNQIEFHGNGAQVAYIDLDTGNALFEDLFINDISGGAGTFTGIVSASGGSSTNWNTAYSHVHSATITLTAGTGLDTGGSFTTNANANKTITFNLGNHSADLLTTGSVDPDRLASSGGSGKYLKWNNSASNAWSSIAWTDLPHISTLGDLPA